MSHSTGKLTKAEQARMNALAAMPCLCCEIECVQQPLRTTIHHIVDRGTRKHSGGHMSTLPLCEWHHQGELLYPLTGREMRFLYGPSLALHKRSFIAQYGDERSLLAKTNQELEARAAA